MSSPRLFSEKLKQLEKSLESINEINQRLTEVSERAQRECAHCETKIKQLIDEITPILNSHAEAIKKLLNGNNAS